MTKRKINIEIEIDDEKVGSLQDLEKEILSKDIYSKIAEKYLRDRQNDEIQSINIRKGSERIRVKTSSFEFDFKARRTINENGKKRLF